MTANQDKARFRVRTATFEVEFEGPADSAYSRYDSMVSQLHGVPLKMLDDDVPLASENTKSKRGGIRSNVTAKAVDQLIGEDWFDTKRTESSVLEELQNRHIPGVEKGNLRLALARRVRAGKLKSIRNGDNWVYWRE
jgi:hypothetical protein